MPRSPGAVTCGCKDDPVPPFPPLSSGDDLASGLYVRGGNGGGGTAETEPLATAGKERDDIVDLASWNTVSPVLDLLATLTCDKGRGGANSSLLLTGKFVELSAI
jgi:hypothetical protein